MGKMFNNKTIGLAMQLPKQYIARAINIQPPMPFNYTLSITSRCNSRCKTCRIYDQRKTDMSLDEWEKIIKSLGHSPYWVTLSGGEPFLRQDLDKIIYMIDTYCQPAIINIPTNGLCSNIAEQIKLIASQIKSKLVINVSIDHNNPSQNDFIRGVDGAYGKAIKTFTELKRIKSGNLTVGIHTVISRFNVNDFYSICDSMLNLEPDQYITEIAEERKELGSVGLGITPGIEEYTSAIDYLLSKMQDNHIKGLPGITSGFRTQYYNNVKRWLSGDKHGIGCYAGRGVAHISSDGEVWACCIKAESMGNLKESDYSFNDVWHSRQADEIRQEVHKCICPMANVAYTNLLLHPFSMVKIIKHIML